MGKNCGGNIMLFTVATKVVASQPPERRLTGALTVRANLVYEKLMKQWNQQHKSLFLVQMDKEDKKETEQNLPPTVTFRE